MKLRRLLVRHQNALSKMGKIFYILYIQFVRLFLALALSAAIAFATGWTVNRYVFRLSAEGFALYWSLWFLLISAYILIRAKKTSRRAADCNDPTGGRAKGIEP